MHHATGIDCSVCQYLAIAIVNDATQDMRSYKKIDDHNLEMTVKKDGKVTMTGNLVIAADGKSRTVTITGTDAKGEKFTNTAVYDKQ